MTALPAHVPTGLQAQVSQDVTDVLLSDWKAPAVYRNGAGDGVAIIVHLSDTDDTSANPAKGRVSSHRRRTISVVIPADRDGADAGGGVTADGKVISLKNGHTLRVHGPDVGMPVGEVTLRIGSDPQLTERAYWTAEASL